MLAFAVPAPTRSRSEAGMAVMLWITRWVAAGPGSVGAWAGVVAERTRKKTPTATAITTTVATTGSQGLLRPVRGRARAPAIVRAAPAAPALGSGLRLVAIAYLHGVGRVGRKLRPAARPQPVPGDRHQGDRQRDRRELGLLQAQGRDRVVAQEEDAELGDGVQGQVDEEQRARPRAKTPANDEQDAEDAETDQQLVEGRRLVGHPQLGGHGVRVRVREGPGEVRGGAQDLAVEDVPDPPDGLPGGGEERGRVGHDPEVHALPACVEEDEDGDRPDGPEVGHAALPGGEQVLGVGQIVAGPALEVVVEPGGDQAQHDAPEGQVGVILLAEATSPEVAPRQPQADQEGHRVADAIPADGERPQPDEDGAEGEGDHQEGRHRRPRGGDGRPVGSAPTRGRFAPRGPPAATRAPAAPRVRSDARARADRGRLRMPEACYRGAPTPGGAPACPPTPGHARRSPLPSSRSASRATSSISRSRPAPSGCAWRCRSRTPCTPCTRKAAADPGSGRSGTPAARASRIERSTSSSSLPRAATGRPERAGGWSRPTCRPGWPRTRSATSSTSARTRAGQSSGSGPPLAADRSSSIQRSRTDSSSWARELKYR